jgi:hypothetical protein
MRSRFLILGQVLYLVMDLSLELLVNNYDVFGAVDGSLIS